MKRCAELTEEDGRDVVAPSIRSAFIRAHGQRDMSAQVYMRVPLNARMYVTSTFVRAGTCSLQRECVVNSCYHLFTYYQYVVFTRVWSGTVGAL